MVAALRMAASAVVRSEGEAGRDAVAALLVDIASLRFDPTIFVASATTAAAGSARDTQLDGRPSLPRAGAPRPAPALLDCLSALNLQIFHFGGDVVAAAKADASGFKAAVHEAIVKLRESAGAADKFTTSHVAVAASIGEGEFVEALLERLLDSRSTAGPSSSGGAALVSLPLTVSSETALPGLLDSVDGVKALLVAQSWYASVPRSNPPAPAAPEPLLRNDEAATRFVHLFFDEVLRANVAQSVVNRATSGTASNLSDVRAASNDMIKLRALLARLTCENTAAMNAFVKRACDAAAWSHNVNSSALTQKGGQVGLEAAHGYTLQYVIRDVAQAVALHTAKHAWIGDPTAATVSKGLGASDALALLFALAKLQPVCLVQRSRFKRTEATAKLAAEDWNLLRMAGVSLLALIVDPALAAAGASLSDHARPPVEAAASTESSSTEVPPNATLHRLLSRLRRMTQDPTLERNVFISEQVFFLGSALNYRPALRAVTFSEALQLLVPTAVRCALATRSPALRSVGHLMLAAIVVEKHPAALCVLPTYVNLFVSSPRSRQAIAAPQGSDETTTLPTPGGSYGPVPIDSLKLFGKYWRAVALAAETIDANPVYSPDVDGASLLKWAFGQLATVGSYYISLPMPTQEERERRRRYTCALIDCLQLTNPVALNTACAAVEALLLQMPNVAEASVFLDYASTVVQAGTSVATKKSMAEWLISIRDRLAERTRTVRSKL
jgi:hypothetical protein